MPSSPTPPVIDYEGSNYRTDFWEGQGRDYEDRAERVAIRRLLPASGERIIEVGAGFGRLAPLYAGYQQVVLFDYSRSQLEFARQRYGDDGYLYVAGNIYAMPFAPRVFDAAVMVRVLHHMQDAPAALRSIRDILRRGGIFVLEFANKQNLKAIGRWLLRRQTWNPFQKDPVEFAPLHFDFHPTYVRRTLAASEFAPERMLTVSHFRLGLLKRLIPAGLLVSVDALAQLTGNLWQLTPSVFVRSEAVGAGASSEPPAAAFWRCPGCTSLDLAGGPDGLTCRSCGTRYARRNGIYDFKEPAAS